MCNQRTCPECTTSFSPKREHGRFCQPSCAKTWNNRHTAKGGPLALLVKAWLATRHAKPGTRDAEIRRYAMAELTRMGRDLLDDDMAHDRDVCDVVGAMMDAGEQYTDRQQKTENALEVRKHGFRVELTDMGHNMLAATIADLEGKAKPRTFARWQVQETRKAMNAARRRAMKESARAQREAARQAA